MSWDANVTEIHGK